MPRKPIREKKLIGGRYQFPPSADQPSFQHPLGEPTDAVVAFLKRKEEVHEKAPTYPVLEKPRDGVIGRYKCVPRMVHIPDQLGPLPPKVDIEREYARERAVLNDQYARAAHKLSLKNIKVCDQLPWQRKAEQLKSLRSDRARRYLDDMFKSVSQHEQAVMMKGREIAGPSDFAKAPRINTDITAWCDNVLNNFWIYEATKK